MLAESVLRPKIQAQEVEYARQVVQFELESLNMRPEQDPLLMDMIHAAAYRDNTLGLPKLCPPANIPLIDRDVLLSYLRLHHTPSRMVVAGVGVDHDEFVKHVEKFFANEAATWEMESVGNKSVTEVDTSISQYTGGIVKVSATHTRIEFRRNLLGNLLPFCRKNVIFQYMQQLDYPNWRTLSSVSAS